MKRQYLTLRGTYVGQSLPSESYYRIKSFLKGIIRIRLNKNINDLYLILNEDEAPLFFNITVNKTVGWILLILAFFSGREEGIGETLNNIYSLAVFVLFIYAIVKLSQLKNGKLDPNAERIRIDGKNAVIDSSVVITDNTNHESVPASPGTKYCPSCGSLQESAAKFCTNCGQKLD